MNNAGDACDEIFEVRRPDLAKVLEIAQDCAFRWEFGFGIEHLDGLDEVRIPDDRKWPVRCCDPESDVYAQQFLLVGAAARELLDRALSGGGSTRV